MRCVIAIAVGMIAVGMIAACGDDRGPALREFRFTRPGPALELVPVPDEPVVVAWEADGDGALAVDVTLVPVNPPGRPRVVGTARLDEGGVTGAIGLTPPRAGIYQIAATIRDGATVIDERTATSIVLVQGAEFRDAAVTFTGGAGDRDLAVTATTASIIGIELYLAADVAAPRWVIARGSIASDLAPIGRVYTFTGTTIEGAAIPAGTHGAFLEITTRDGAVRYQRGGLSLTWTP